MTKNDAIKHYGSASNLADKLLVTRSAVSQWPEKLPYGRQLQIQLDTEGKLKADPVERKTFGSKRQAS